MEQNTVILSKENYDSLMENQNRLQKLLEQQQEKQVQEMKDIDKKAAEIAEELIGKKCKVVRKEAYTTLNNVLKVVHIYKIKKTWW